MAVARHRSSRVIVVAGADRADGGALAEEFAAAGAHIVLTGADAIALGVLASSLRDAFAVRVAVYPGRPAPEPLAEMITELFTRH